MVMAGAAPLLIVLLALFLFSGPFGRMAVIGLLLIGFLWLAADGHQGMEDPPMAVPVEPDAG